MGTCITGSLNALSLQRAKDESSSSKKNPKTITEKERQYGQTISPFITYGSLTQL